LSDRLTARNDLLAALNSLAISGCTVGVWEGDEKAFDPTAAALAYYVGAPDNSAGVYFGPPLEVPPPGVQAATYERRIRWAVYVAAKGADAEADADDLLEAAEDALAGRELVLGGQTLRWAPTGEEALLSVVLDTRLYAQTWEVRQLVCRQP
jgi:hypothetical protein